MIRGSPQPQSITWSKASSRATSPTETVTIPAVVHPGVLDLGLRRWISRMVTKTANADTGTLRKKIQRQLSRSVSAPADQGSRGVADPGGAEDEPAGQPGPILRQRRIGHAEDRGPHQRPADAHQHSHRDQLGLGLGRATERREGREDRGPDEERATAPKQVCEAAAGDDQDAEGERVGVDDPLGRRHVGLEVVLDLGDRDVDRREIVRDHEDRDTHRDQREPGSTVDWLHPTSRLRVGQHEGVGRRVGGFLRDLRITHARAGGRRRRPPGPAPRSGGSRRSDRSAG